MTSTTQSGITLLAILLIGYAYFLPAILAFLRGHPRFWAILGLNILIAPAQLLLFHYVLPSLFIVAHVSAAMILVKSFFATMGVGWAVVLAWSLTPVAVPNLRLIAARNTKIFDFVAAIPLMLWFLSGVLQLRPLLTQDAAQMLAGRTSLIIWVQFFSLSLAALSSLICIYLLVVREKPVLKSRGSWPRIFGILGTFLGVGLLQLRPAALDLPMQLLAALLVGLGSGGQVIVLSKLGKSFSILPEARTLVTDGPYAYVRHPLYTVEIVSLIGTAIQFVQPQAAILLLITISLLVGRSMFEERVLTEAYPTYRDYRRRTKRFIPGLI